MQTFKLVQIIKSSFSIIFLTIINSLYSFGQNSNQINQANSKNTNTQIGSRNSSKTDNRKFNKTISNNQQEISSYNGPLFSGDNPFVVINNINPNKDSINYEIQLKKKTIRIQLSRYMLTGHEFSKQCIKVEDSSYQELTNKVINWNQEVFTFLLSNLDESYARQFDLATKNDAIYMGLPKKFEDLNDFIIIRNKKLDEFIRSLY